MNITLKNLLLPFLLTLAIFATRDIGNEQLNKIVAKVDPRQLVCLAKNIYYEAGNESTEGKAAVARVVMNRIHAGFGKNPCQVVYQSTVITRNDEERRVCQFSWVCEGKDNPNTHSLQYQSSLLVAYNVLTYDMYQEVIPRSTLFFHNLSVEIDSSWPYRKVKQIGNHVFYDKKNKQ
jgi:spore germination cell wall hydrolase CwlJ-like protein